MNRIKFKLLYLDMKCIIELSILGEVFESTRRVAESQAIEARVRPDRPAGLPGQKVKLF